MTVRNFDGVDDFITLSTGAVSGTAAFTMLALVNRGAGGGWRSVIDLASNTTTRRGIQASPGNVLTYVQGTSTYSTTSWGTGEGWVIVAITKASGNNAARGHKYSLTTETWTRVNAGSNAGNVQSANTIRIGEMANFNEFFAGRMAGLAWWDRQLADSELDGLVASFQSWLDATPTAMWPLTQDSVSTAVEDITGGGADQTAITGTNVVTDDDPPGFGLSLGEEQPHEVTATIPLSLLFDPVAEATHEVTSSIPLSVDVDVTAQASHSVAASIPLSLTVEPEAAAPGVGAHEVTCTIPLTIALDPMAQARHDVTAQIPLTLDVQATASAPTVGEHEVTAVIPLTLLVSAQSLAAHQVAAEIPLSVDIAPTVEAVHEVTATIPLVLAVDAVTGDLVDTSLALAPHTTVVPSPHVSTVVPSAHVRTTVPDAHVRTVIPSLHVTTTLE